jgi:hypothetical protein
MPTIATQTIDCVDVIDQLNKEFEESQNQLVELQNQLRQLDFTWISQLEKIRVFRLELKWELQNYLFNYTPDHGYETGFHGFGSDEDDE